MSGLQTSIEIEAPIETIWSVLTDFAAYPEWNPFIRRLEGDLVMGSRLTVVLQPDGLRPSTFRPTVVELEPGRSFAWLGHVLIPGILDGRHRFELRPGPGTASTLEQTEMFSGVLVPLVGGTLAAARRGFVRMNEVVKDRSEAAAP